MYSVLNMQFSKTEICQNQIPSSAFPFMFSLEKSKGWIGEAEDTKSSRTAASQQVCLVALHMEDWELSLLQQWKVLQKQVLWAYTTSTTWSANFILKIEI